MSTITQVITWQSPSGAKINVSPSQERRLRAAGIWPRDWQGQEYCQISHGMHAGTPATDEELGLDSGKADEVA